MMPATSSVAGIIFQPTPKDSLSDKDRGPAAPPSGEKKASTTSSTLQELVRPAHSEGGPTAGVVAKTKELVQRFRDTPGDTLRERWVDGQLPQQWHWLNRVVPKETVFPGWALLDLRDMWCMWW